MILIQKLNTRFGMTVALFHFLTEKNKLKRYTEIVNRMQETFSCRNFSKLGPSKM